MRIVFMGTPDFAVPSLNRVAELHEVVAVYSRPDAVSGRGGSRLPSPVSVSATALGLDVRTPVSLRDPSELESLRALAPDALIVAAYGLILPGEVLGAARLGGINVHGSLLPRWRGAAPVQRAILAGDQVTGVSIMQMEVGLDTGPYCAVTEVQIDGKDAATLTAELAEVGARLLVEALPRIDDGTAIWTVQDEALATYAEKISKADVAPSPELSVDSNLRRVRASTPAAPSRITLAGRGVTLLECRESEVVVTQGSILSTKSALVLGSADGSFEAVTVKPDGKGAMDGAAYGRGLRIDPTDEWGYAR